ncbi:MAG TPA: insulinase family protein [Verrucomicrobiae bacterium]|nr:insulinase family protein [Verrucomicrobiae bacterium]
MDLLKILSLLNRKFSSSKKWLLLLTILCGGCNRHQAQTQIEDLPNGIRLVSVNFPGSTNVSIFTFTGMGLATDAPGQAQWAHLVEHLVVRSTVPGDLAHANAETLIDHMRLDTYGSLADWRSWLSHHRRWIEGVPFSQTSLETEKPRVISECDVTARNLMTSKFAFGAWAQAHRHGLNHVALKGDVLAAKLNDVQALRNAHFAVPGEVTVCVVGGVPTPTALAGLKEDLESLRLTATPVSKVKPKNGDVELTWDLDGRALLMTWPIPDFDDPDYAALMVAGQLLNMKMAATQPAKRTSGAVLAGADLITPEGKFFYVSTALNQAASFDELRERFQAAVDELAAGNDLNQAKAIGQQIAFTLTRVSPPPSFVPLPAGITRAIVEGNLGLRFGMNVHRFGASREKLASNLSAVSPGDVQRVAKKYLSRSSCAVCQIEPRNSP